MHSTATLVHTAALRRATLVHRTATLVEKSCYLERPEGLLENIVAPFKPLGC